MVWLGTPEQVDSIRDATVEISQKLADELELQWYTEVGDDPFYLEGRKVEERGIEFPDVPKYEMRLSVPGQKKGVAVCLQTFMEPTSLRDSQLKKPTSIGSGQAVPVSE